MIASSGHAMSRRGGRVAFRMAFKAPDRGRFAAPTREDLLQTMLDHVAQGIALFDSRRRLAAWNRQLKDIAVFSDAELSGAPAFAELVELMAARGDFGPPSAATDAALRELTGALDAPYSAERMRPDGRIVEIRRTPLPDGGLLVMFGDVSEQRHADYLVQESERGIRNILDKAPVALAVVGQEDGEVKHVNARFRRLFGIAETTAPAAVDLAVHLSPADRTRLINAPARASADDFESEVRRADGSGFWALISPVRFVFEWTPAVLAGFYDVTDRRRAEAGLREELERRQAELNEARALQLELAPPAGAGRAGGWEFRIDVALEPAREVGGDLVDYFRIDDRRLVLVVGDVSHKGAGAALFMARTHSLIRALASRPDAADLFATPAEVARLLNAALARDNARCMFVTLLLGVFDAETGALAYVRAGHVPPFVRRAAGRIERMTDLAGPPLGLVETAVYRSGALALGRGDQVLIVTDGLTEATDPSGAQFGDARLEAFLSGVRSEEPSPLARLISELRAFEGGRPAFDDVAAVLFATLPKR